MHILILELTTYAHIHTLTQYSGLFSYLMHFLIKKGGDGRYAHFATAAASIDVRSAKIYERGGKTDEEQKRRELPKKKEERSSLFSTL